MMDNKPAFDWIRERGMGRATKKATNFSADAYTIVKTLNPLVEIIKVLTRHRLGAWLWVLYASCLWYDDPVLPIYQRRV